jgi:hypothetical protein
MLGLPALASEGTKLHFHAHLDVYVGGEHITIPAGIGIGPRNGFYSPLHTHDTSGILHVESATRRSFTLGQFFGVWGVRLTARCIDGHCSRGNRTLEAFVDGRAAGNPVDIELRPHAEIVLALGTRAQRPKPIPSSYAFPYGL